MKSLFLFRFPGKCLQFCVKQSCRCFLLFFIGKQTDDSCRFFDSSNPNWDKNPTFSMMWLRGQQNILNDILHTRGHVFLNEVYDALGFPHTPQGAVLGWIDGEGDNCIDFGLYDPNKENVRRFVNGVDNVIMLEFNHDGVIWDKI